jgi:hypothetical protein
LAFWHIVSNGKSTHWNVQSVIGLFMLLKIY